MEPMLIWELKYKKEIYFFFFPLLLSNIPKKKLIFSKFMAVPRNIDYPTTTCKNNLNILIFWISSQPERNWTWSKTKQW